MSVVIVGGNDRMVCQYKDVCKDYGCRAKVFTQMDRTIKKKLGVPDLMILFTGTVAHKMVICASSEAKRNQIPIVHAHSSSISALRNILEEHCKQ